MKMKKMKEGFALLVVVAVAGLAFANVGFALAQSPKFVTIKASENVDFTSVGHVCNENYMYVDQACPNRQACLSRAKYMPLPDSPYAKQQMYCTNQAYGDCGNTTNICYCEWNSTDC